MFRFLHLPVGRTLPTTRAAWRRGVTVAGMVLGTSWAVDTRAEDRLWRPELGAFVGFHFGGERGVQLAGGIDIRTVNQARELNCSEHDGYQEAVARLEWVGWHQTRLFVGMGVGTESRVARYGGELGVGYRFRQDPGLELQLGVEGVLDRFWSARVGYAPLRDLSVVTGPQVARSKLANRCWVEGRPLRRGSAVAPPPGVFWGCADGSSHSDAAHAAAVWARRAATEWASVPAFCELASQLQACGAPGALIARARAAAADEFRHALLAGGIATRLSGMSLMLEPPAPDVPVFVGGQAALVRLAVESWIDGCLGEGVAAACAKRESDLASEPAIARAQRTIAADEAGHSDLAWDILTWAVQAGGKEVREAVLRTIPPAPSLGDAAAPQAINLSAFGCASSSQTRALATEHTVRARARFAQAACTG